MRPSVGSAALLAAAVVSAIDSVSAIGSPFQLNEKFCGQWDIRANDQIILYNNHWGGDNDKNGTQCTTVTALDSATGAISYETDAKWAGDTWQVKSFTNIESILTPMRAYEIESLQAQWTIKATDSLDYDPRPVYNAAFDVFFGSNLTAGANPSYEIMVWALARNGAAPLSQYGIYPVTIDGRQWMLHDGSNGPQRVLSFTSDVETTEINVDLKLFVDAAVKYGMPQDLYLVKLQGGFEYFHGQTVLSVSNYLVNVKRSNIQDPIVESAVVRFFAKDSTNFAQLVRSGEGVAVGTGASGAAGSEWFYDTTTKLIKSKDSQYCLDAYEGWNGGSVHVYTCNAQEKNQLWNFDSSTGQLKHVKWAGFCLDRDPSGANGGLIHLWSCQLDNNNQVWRKISTSAKAVRITNADRSVVEWSARESLQMKSLAESDGQSWFYNPFSNTLENKLGGECLDAYQSVENSLVHTWDCIASEGNQMWKFEDGHIKHVTRTGFCLAYKSTAEKVLVLKTCSATDATQIFTLPVADIAPSAPVGPIGNQFQVYEKFCGQWDIRSSDKIILYNNHWGGDNDKSGSQCTTVTSVSASTGAISYETTPKWAGDAWQVKSFTNVETIVTPIHAYEIEAIPAKLKIKATDSLAFDPLPVYNAAFDLFFGSNLTAGALPLYEVMVWVLARNGAAPLSQYGIYPVTIGGRQYQLHDGSNGPQRVLSFTAAVETTEVNLDLKLFVDAAVQYGMPEDLYLVKLQGGFEYFHGQTTLSVSDYLVNVKKSSNPQPIAESGSFRFFAKESLSFAQLVRSGGEVAVGSGAAGAAGSEWTYDSATKLVKSKDSNYCLDGYEGFNGGRVHVYACNAQEKNQLWNFDSSTGQLKHATYGGFCLDRDPTGANGGKLQLWSCQLDNNNQVWRKISTSAKAVRITNADQSVVEWTSRDSLKFTATARSDRQSWFYNSISNTFTNKWGGECLDADQSVENSLVHTWDCIATEGNQKWKFESGQIKHVTRTGFCLALKSATEKVLVLKTCSTSDATQRFTLPAADISVTPPAGSFGSQFRYDETFCGQWDIRSSDKVILYNNHWGADNDKSGSQCTTVTDVSASTGAISYQTSAKWAGDAWQVKSFTNVETVLTPMRAYEIESLQAQWKIKTSDSSSAKYNAAFDVFFGADNSSSNSPLYEVMVWVMTRDGAAPLSQFGIFPVTIGGQQWQLHDGSNGPQRVLSFTSSSQTTEVNMDLKLFVDAAVQHGMSEDLFLVKLQGGFEYFRGESTLTVSDYLVNVKTSTNGPTIESSAVRFYAKESTNFAQLVRLDGEVAVGAGAAGASGSEWIYETSTKLIKSKNSNYCLDAYEGFNGGRVHVYACNSQEKNQLWNFDSSTGQLKHATFGGFCLDRDPSGANGGKLQLWGCHLNNNNQVWRKISASAKAVRITNADQSVVEWSSRNSLQLTSLTKSDGQSWFYNSFSNTFVNKWSGECLDADQSVENSLVHTWDCIATESNQKWKFANGQIQHVTRTGFCLAYKSSSEKVLVLKKCSTSDATQSFTLPTASA